MCTHLLSVSLLNIYIGARISSRIMDLQGAAVKEKKHPQNWCPREEKMPLVERSSLESNNGMMMLLLGACKTNIVVGPLLVCGV